MTLAIEAHGLTKRYGTTQALKRQLGGQTLEVRPLATSDLPRVRVLLARVGTDWRAARLFSGASIDQTSSAIAR